MVAPATGPCAPWITDPTTLSCCPNWGSVPPTVQAIAAQIATEVVWNVTGRVYNGPCARVEWPCVECVCRCDPCLCGPYYAVDLGPETVASITAVTVDGVVLAASAYRVDDWRRLVRIDGRPWPRCQQLGKDIVADPVGTWSVEWMAGVAPPLSILAAAEIYACEWGKACAGLPCQLPRNIIETIAREGVTFALVDPTALLKEGLTGLVAADNLIRAWQSGARRSSHLFDPAASRPHRVGT